MPPKKSAGPAGAAPALKFQTLASEAPAGNLVYFCHKCARPINDRYLMKMFPLNRIELRAASCDAGNKSATSDQQPTDYLFYHEHCLRCSTCSRLLERSCFVRNSKLYCPHDYFR